MTTSRRTLGLLMLACATFAGACSDESAADTVSTTPDTSEVGAVPMAASSPIGAFFADGGGFEAAQANYTIMVEEQIVLCMAAQGFEFGRSGNDLDDAQIRQSELSVRAWTAEYGYGVSTSFGSIAQRQASNPNAAITFALSEKERNEWTRTLTGSDFGASPDPGASFEDLGCIGDAIIETGGQEAFEGLETFDAVYQEGTEALLNRREMVDAVDAWSRCLGAAGYPGFSTLNDPEDHIAQEFEKVTAPMAAALAKMSSEEGQALISGDSLDLADLPDLDLDMLRDLQTREIALALVDLDCYESEVRSTYEPLRDRFENGLLVEYASEFDALKNIGV